LKDTDSVGTTTLLNMEGAAVTTTSLKPAGVAKWMSLARRGRGRGRRLRPRRHGGRVVDPDEGIDGRYQPVLERLQ
jgi:hypothetical protein